MQVFFVGIPEYGIYALAELGLVKTTWGGGMSVTPIAGGRGH